MKDCIFCKIARHEVPKEFLYEDKDLMVFPDINPAKPVHILIVPKKHVEDLSDLDDKNLLWKIEQAAVKHSEEEKLNKKGYRLHVNAGGAQIIDHLHFHLTGPIEKGYRF
jgi:histidine triad (HIT) family protein